MSSLDEKIANFVEITSAPSETAKAFLESAGYDVEAALSAYFENGGNPPTSAANTATQGAAGGHQNLVEDRGRPDRSDLVEDVGVSSFGAGRTGGFGGVQAWSSNTAQGPFQGGEFAPRQPASSRARDSAKKSKGRAGGVRTLADIGNGDDDDDEDQNEYFAGGEKSGQLVRGAGGRSDEVAERLFESARRMGAKTAEEDDELYGSEEKSGKTFRGSGFRLGDHATGHEEIPAQGTSQEPQTVRRCVTFWSNGFSVDNGPLRDPNDPANSAFIADLSRGLAPRELERELPPGARLAVDLVRKNTEYEPPRGKDAAFSGEGFSMVDGNLDTATDNTERNAEVGEGLDGWKQRQEGPREVVVDESQPIAEVQIRLASGERIVGRFNHSHTVDDIRAFIATRTSKPELYELFVPFPRQPLNDKSKTIGELQLAGAAIMQRSLE